MLSKILAFIIHLFRQNSRSSSVFLGHVSEYFISIAFIYNLNSHLLTEALFVKFSVPRELQPCLRLKKIRRQEMSQYIFMFVHSHLLILFYVFIIFSLIFQTLFLKPESAFTTWIWESCGTFFTSIGYHSACGQMKFAFCWSVPLDRKPIAALSFFMLFQSTTDFTVQSSQPDFF